MAHRRREIFTSFQLFALYSIFFFGFFSKNPVTSAREEEWRRTFTGISTGEPLSTPTSVNRGFLSLSGKNLNLTLTTLKILGDMTLSSSPNASQILPLLKSEEPHPSLDPISKVAESLESELFSASTPRSMGSMCLVILVNLRAHRTSSTLDMVMKGMMEGLTRIHQAYAALALSVVLFKEYARSPLVPAQTTKDPAMPQASRIFISPPTSRSSHTAVSAKGLLGFPLVGLGLFDPLVDLFWPIYKIGGPLSLSFWPKFVLISKWTFPCVILNRHYAMIGRGLLSRQMLIWIQSLVDYARMAISCLASTTISTHPRHISRKPWMHFLSSSRRFDLVGDAAQSISKDY